MIYEPVKLFNSMTPSLPCCLRLYVFPAVGKIKNSIWNYQTLLFPRGFVSFLVIFFHSSISSHFHFRAKCVPHDRYVCLSACLFLSASLYFSVSQYMQHDIPRTSTSERPCKWVCMEVVPPACCSGNPHQQIDMSTESTELETMAKGRLSERGEGK